MENVQDVPGKAFVPEIKKKKPLKDYRLCEENSRANVKELPLAKYREV